MSFTIGAKLLALKDRSGLSLAEIARQAGYKAPSSIQKMFREDYAPPTLPTAPAMKLVLALAGRGSPPITTADVLALTNTEEDSRPLIAALTNFAGEWAKTIRILQTKRVTPRGGASGFEEAYFRLLNENVSEFVAPDILHSKVVWGFYVSTANMHPRYEVGEPALAQMRPPPRPGDDVVITIRHDSDFEAEPGTKLICRLISDDGQRAVFEQFNPPGQFSFPSQDVADACRLLTVMDFLRDHTL